ncbi:hypothetical protein ABXS75_03175 [Roseburia hominis]
MKKERLQIMVDKPLYDSINKVAEQRHMSVSKIGSLLLDEQLKPGLISTLPEKNAEQLKEAIETLNEQLCMVMNYHRQIGVNLNQLARTYNTYVKQAGGSGNLDDFNDYIKDKVSFLGTPYNGAVEELPTLVEYIQREQRCIGNLYLKVVREAGLFECL